MIGGILIPPQVLIVPIFQELNAMGLLNTYWAVIFPQVAAVVAVFVFKQFFDGLPRDFEEAARIDGAGFWTIYRSVVLPLSRPVIGAISIITFVDVWNNLILPTVCALESQAHDDSRRTGHRAGLVRPAPLRHPGVRHSRGAAARHLVPHLSTPHRRGRRGQRPQGLIVRCRRALPRW